MYVSSNPIRIRTSRNLANSEMLCFFVFLNCKSFQKFIETLQGKHFKNFLFFLEFAFNFLRFEFFLVMVCDFVVLCCFRIGKKMLLFGDKKQISLPISYQFRCRLASRATRKWSRNAQSPLAPALSFPEKQLDNFVASKDSEISMQKIEIFKALLQNPPTEVFVFFDSPSIRLGPVHLKHRFEWSQLWMPTADAKSPVCLKFRRQRKNKALVLPGSGRCYLSLGGARTDWANGAITWMAPLIFMVRNGVCERRFGKKVVLMTLWY